MNKPVEDLLARAAPIESGFSPNGWSADAALLARLLRYPVLKPWKRLAAMNAYLQTANGEPDTVVKSAGKQASKDGWASTSYCR